MIHIAIADDQYLFRKGIITLLNELDNCRVIVEAENGKELVDEIRKCKNRIDVTLLDISMPVMNGLECMKVIRSAFPHIKNIILSVHEEENYIGKFIEEGANAYLAKNARIEEVETAIKGVIKSDFYFNEATVRAMHTHLHKRGKQQLTLGSKGLTNREIEILKLICEENTSAEIAEKLFVTESTVNGHRNNLLLKVGCKNTAGLVLFAIKNNIYLLDDL